MECYVINLDRSPDRWEHMQKQLSTIGTQHTSLKIQRVVGVDGYKLTENEISFHQQSAFSLSKIACPRDLSKAEIGCYLSHKKCWEKLINSSSDWGLILEDDITIFPSASKYIESPSWIPKGIDLVQIFIPTNPWLALVDKKNIKLLNNATLYHPLKPSPIGCLAYFISKKAAKEAIEHSQKLSMPVDEFLFSPLSAFAKHHPVWRLNPAVICHGEFQSAIQAKDCKDRNAYGNNYIAKYNPLRYILRQKHNIKKLFALRQTFTIEQ